MRLAFIIVVLAAIAMVLVQMRRVELSAGCEIQQMRLEKIAFDRKYKVQQAQLAYIYCPTQVHQRFVAMGLDLVQPEPSQKRIVTGFASGK